jgi:outer membrane translocation and assembly module TamA
MARTLRLVAGVDLDWLEEDEANRLLVLGGSNGLRGYDINQFAGKARLLAHLELRTRPLHLLRFYRLGAVAFWDAGDAAASVSDLGLNHAVGVGLRSLIPQLDTLVIRLDWAFALNGPEQGWPGRVTLGVLQVF